MGESRKNPVQEGEESPLVVSLCGTYLKLEMQSLYRQITGLQEFRNVVFAENVSNLERFPFDPVVHMQKQERPRFRGNFLLRFWYKHLTKQWPPPRPIGYVGHEGEYYHPYDLVELLEQWKPDLVHVYYGHKAVKYRRMLEASGIPWLVSFHGVDVVKFMDDPEYVKGLEEVFQQARVVMARSESLLDRLRDLGCPDEKLRMNRTPVPLQSIEFKQREIPADGRWRLLQACRLIPKKGLFTVLKALPKVISVWPELKYVLCGSGPDEERLRDEVKKAGLEANVEIRGWVSQDELKDEFAKAHLFLHPSELTETEDQEGVPNAMLEAMAAGLPVVATQHGGIPEAVTDGKDGILVEEKDFEALSEAILKIASDETLLTAYSCQAKESVKERFGFDEQIAAMEACYRETMTR